MLSPVIVELAGVEDKPCAQCALLKEWLEVEREKKDYYERLLLVRSGIINSEVQSIVDEENYLPLRRITTMSSMRQAAASIVRERASKNNTEELGSLTEAEKKFQESLNRVRE